MTTDIREDDLLRIIEETKSSPLEQLAEEIAALPEIDTDKVKAVLDKLDNNSIDMLAEKQERLTSAMRIAQKIIEESNSR